MTNKEAIEILKGIYPNGAYSPTEEQCIEAINMAISALTTTPEEPEQNQVVLYGLTGSVNEEGSARGKEYVCPKCGGHMNLDTSAICTSIPPKYKLVCDNCHYLDFVDCSEVRKEEPVLPGTEQYEDKIAWRDYVPVDAVEAAELCGKWKIVPIEPASEDLEEEIAKYFKGWYNDDEYKDACKPDYTGVSVEECKDIAHHFANWQNEQMTEALRTEYEKGRADAIAEMQKPAWSEEDEKGLGDALWCCKQAASIAKDENDMGNAWFAENWLKSLKEKCTWAAIAAAKRFLQEESEKAYVVTRCEEHSDYVERVFFDKNKAEEYCAPYNENEHCYSRDITEIDITL